jgi:hypothetical protein
MSNPAAAATTPILLDELENWSAEQADPFLEAIVRDPEMKAFIRRLMQAPNAPITSLATLVTALWQGMLSRLKDMPEPDPKLTESLADVARYLATMRATTDAYNAKTKPNPGAVFWPNPQRGTSLFETLPTVSKLGLVSKTTPVGSAGSCFAFEIAYSLQRRGFNYVVTEKGHQPEAGVFLDSHKPDDVHERFTAGYGILFNTPSFRQLAEKAFHERELPRLLTRRRADDGRWMYADPYRENVYFSSVEAYAEDYEKHRTAVREGFLKSEVFIITLGLNECWEYMPDGSVISRNPSSSKALNALLRHKVLTVEENVANVQRFIDVIRAHNPKFKLIVSVSPIPFLATGLARTTHVVTANGHSKAVLRVAAEELVKRNKDVHYLPSFELVTSCIKDAWEDDQRHVKRSSVDRVMTLFDAMFVAGS